MLSVSRTALPAAEFNGIGNPTGNNSGNSEPLYRITVGLSAKACTALAAAGVNIDMINQGSSEISVMFGIKATDRKRAIKALYNAFFP